MIHGVHFVNILTKIKHVLFRLAFCTKYSLISHYKGSHNMLMLVSHLTHWGRATHICVSKFTISASDNGLSPGRCQAIIWNNAGILSIGLLGTNFSEILIKIMTFSFKKMRLKVSYAKWRPFCLCLNVLKSMSRRHVNPRLALNWFLGSSAGNRLKHGVHLQ